MILHLSQRDIGDFQAGIQIFLVLICVSVPFAVRNTKVAGILLLIVTTLSFGVAIATASLEQVVGYILFLIAGIMALIHKNDGTKKKRKAFTLILGFLDKISSVNEWNERLHELHRQLKIYEDVLPLNVRYAINSIATDTDLRHLRKQIGEQLSKLHSESIERDIKVAAIVFAISFVTMITGINALGLSELVAQPLTNPNEFFKRNFVSVLSLLQNGQSGTVEEPNEENHIPIARAGNDRTGNEREKILLDGSGSQDLDGDSLKYAWKKLDGPRVSLDNENQKIASFMAPEVTDDVSFLFELAVSDGNSEDSDKMKLTINNVEEPSSDETSNEFPPTVQASVEPNSVSYSDCDELQMVKLHAIGKDREGPVSYKWEQTEGDSVTLLESDDQSDVTFEAPCKAQKLSFTVVVKDIGAETDTDDVSVDVFVPLVGGSTSMLPPAGTELKIDSPPTVKASVVPKELKFSECVNKATVNLFANGKDAEGQVSYKWEQVKGEQVSLNHINLGQNDFSQVFFNLGPPCKGQALSFAVTVEDNNGATDTDEISIQISDPEDPDLPPQTQDPDLP